METVLPARLIFFHFGAVATAYKLRFIQIKMFHQLASLNEKCLQSEQITNCSKMLGRGYESQINHPSFYPSDSKCSDDSKIASNKTVITTRSGI